MWRYITYGALMWIVSIYAFRRGGWEEKLGATANIIVSYLSPLVVAPEGNQFRHIETMLLEVDLIFFLSLLIIASKSRKFWPMWYAAMAAMPILAHLLPYMPLPTQIRPYIYFRAEALWGWPMWILLAVSVYRHVDRQTAVPQSG